MKILECQQGTPEWDAARLGKPTSSNFSKIIDTKGKRSATRGKYMAKLAGEIITGKKKDGYKSKSMGMGNEVEPEARFYFEGLKNVIVDQVGFCFLDSRRNAGSSPDGLIRGTKTGLEIKSHEADVQIAMLEHGNRSRAEHFQQIQGNLWVTGYEEWILLDYSPGLKHIETVFKRDEDYIKTLAKEVELFNIELLKMVERVRL